MPLKQKYYYNLSLSKTKMSLKMKQLKCKGHTYLNNTKTEMTWKLK